MADPIAVISLVEGSIGLVLQCGSVAKTLSDMIAKFKHAEVSITSMIQEVETIQFAWNRIKEWSEEHAEAATDSQFVQRLEKSLQCGTLVLSALEQDLANYKHTADNASFRLRSKMAWNERAFLDHQHRVRGQVQAMTMMLQVSQLSTPKAQSKLLDKKEKALRVSDESAYSIVPSRMSSHMPASSRSRDSISSIESKELVYYPLSFEDDLFTARVYKRNYRSPWVNTLFKLHRGKKIEERRVLVAENESLLSSPSTGIPTLANMSVEFSQSRRSNQERSLPDIRPISAGPALTTETKADPTERSVTILDSIPPTSEEGLSIGSGLQNGATDLNKLYPAEGQPDVLGAIDLASGHILQIDNESTVAVARPSPAPETQNKMNSSLLLAVEKGNLDDVEILIYGGAQVNPDNVPDIPPLHLAIRQRNVYMAELLLREGANCAQEWHGILPVHQACIQGDIQTALLLLDAGPLHKASDLVNLLISQGADVNARTSTNWTPLHLSCKGPNIENVRTLLIHGADPNSICESGKTALHTLAESVIDSILYEELSAIFRLLHDHGADFSAKDELGDTPLHLAAKRIVVDPSIILDRWVALFKLLLIHGANIHVPNCLGNTPFHTLLAVCDGSFHPAQLEAVASLSSLNGINVEAKNKAGDTPLHISVRRFRQSEAFIRLLLEHGVDVNVQNEVGDTPLHVLVSKPMHGRIGCIEFKAMIQLLIQLRADPDTRNKAGDTPLHT